MPKYKKYRTAAKEINAYEKWTQSKTEDKPKKTERLYDKLLKRQEKSKKQNIKVDYSKNSWRHLKHGGKIKKSNYNGWDIQPT